MPKASEEAGWRLSEHRDRIDALDKEIQELLAERARHAQTIAQIKHQYEPDRPFYRPEREIEVLQRVIDRHNGPLPQEDVVRIFREIMSACLALEQRMAVAFFGPEGSFTEAALRKHFGGTVRGVPFPTIGDVFREVATEGVEFGVVPVENSAEGIVGHTHDLFMNSKLVIMGEVILRVRHQLLARAQDLASINRVAAHPQALAQCREWLDTHLAHVERIAVSNNAEAARRAAEEDGLAAIASMEAAQRWQLIPLARNIEDTTDNSTRFLVIGRTRVGATGNDKTSLMLTASNEPGSLHALLEPFARRGISLVRIESRPSKRALWEYVFFIDIMGHEEDAPIAEALVELEAQGQLVKRLGSYPRAI